MLKNSKAFSGFSVNDIDAAHQFYGEVLGLQVDKTEDMGGMLTIHIDGNQNNILVYNKPDHQPANYTILNFPVKDMEATVKELTARGVKFEIYDSEYLKTDEHGVSKGNGGPTIAWFKDPAGNFLSVLEPDSGQ
ncbi:MULTISPECIES: VOC family protein [unclassified Mucilaginibacter]|uniref:VOC family protein n=1 Tax=unclassified Mucilaginibacter TaxID=2617802 RepID=UPI002AC98781|nr:MULTISPECIES: VOC family protein [unclassified Mucilaginibacter]MEB0278312.1 VOC family protein [Mucilaginibacter sp. 10B2]MEB0301189.1 VOC family protein [Mucilaginibacter sp. 5C4]WPX23958.1 VOC family protein [Mucilaginibacter sp. 5C4]